MNVLALLVLSVLAMQDAPGSASDSGEQGVISLSLERAIAESLRNNLGMLAAELDTEASIAQFGSTWGDFDSEFFVTVDNSNSVQAPAPVTFAGGVNVGASPTTEFDLLVARAGFRGRLETGTSWELSGGPTKAQTTVHSFTTTVESPPGSGNYVKVNNPRSKSNNITGQWTFSLTQPLLRGGTDDYPMSGLELAAKDVSIAGVASQSRAYTTLVEVVTAYWNLVYSRQNLDTVKMSVGLAEDLLSITQRKFQQGIQNRIDIIEVEADLARREEELLTAKNAVRQAVDELLKIAFAPESREEWNRDIIPVTEYETAPDDGEVNTEAAVRDALALRPDVASARLDLERAEIEVRRAVNQARPRLDVTGSYGLNSNEETTASAMRSLHDSNLSELRVFIDYQFSIGNRTAGYALRRRKIDRERASVSLREVEVGAVSEVRSSARDVTLQTERVKATAGTTRLRLEVYEGERRRLENDLSTAFQVREAQRDYLAAVDEETRARLDLAIAQTSLLASRGRLLEHYGFVPSMPVVSLEDAPPSL
ncbi:MAG: TolC family protein [Planctomycetota bacterium]|jgi:outer membrane protein TolC|nr:TolC family protein [Planctomycetota bacterium]